MDKTVRGIKLWRSIQATSSMYGIIEYFGFKGFLGVYLICLLVIDKKKTTLGQGI